MSNRNEKIEISRQIDEIKIMLTQGKTRQDILELFGTKYNLKKASIDNRLAEARKQLKNIANEEAEAFKNENKEEIRKRQELIHKSLKRSIELIATKLSLTETQTVEFYNYEKGITEKKVINVSALSINDLKKIWEVLKIEAGEPTSIIKSDNDNKNTNIMPMQLILTDIETKNNESDS